MCGFLGWFRSSRTPWREEERARQSAALKSITHRGPDDGSEALGEGWWMGFRRLSILDLSKHGRQPMRFGGGRYTLTFNGEIYNFRELRRELGEAHLDSTGDTIVLGTLIARDGIDAVLPRLRGMFAIAWRDEQSGTLTLARDHFGIKPLYWSASEDGSLCYGSELRGVKHLRGDAKLSPEALAEFLRWGAVQAPHTMLEGIHCLPPGHLLEWHEGRVELRRWFEPRWPGREAWISDPAEQQRRVREGVMSSVQAHLVADVPVGVFLSGGLDSTLLAACMRTSGQEVVKAFSIGYENDAGVPDETDAAERTAKHLGCSFFRERLSAASLESKLDAYFDAMDQPTGDALNTWLVSQVAAREVKVALSGLGADEWWAGYNYHRLAAVAAKSPLKVAGPLMREMNRILPASLKGKPSWKALFYGLGGAGSDPQAWQAHGRSILPPEEVARLLRQTTPMPATPRFDVHAPDSWLHDLLLRETQSYLANTLLRDNDWTSMSHSLELRVPLVDAEVFALAGIIPPEAKLTPGGGKRTLREAFRELLPPCIYDDRHKKTFTLPLMKWMRLPQWQQRIRDTLESHRCRERGLFDTALTSRMCDDYFSSQLDSMAAWPLSQRVWQLYVFEEWARRHLDPA
jgi:asparagine synthase (glutamine-hydrolysing)